MLAFQARMAEKIMSLHLPPLVVKVGGSLYDLPDLRLRLRSWLKTQNADEVILVPGGGVLVEAIRSLDGIHHLGEEACHWLALRACSINAQFLAQLQPDATIVDDPTRKRPTGTGETPIPPIWLRILDAYAFALADEARPGHLPHSWAVTSDSLGVRVAMLSGASELALLKSVGLPAGTSWREAERRGIVDHHFCEILPANLHVRIVNLRAE